MPSQAIVYLRISDDRAGDELGVTRQREDCLALVANRGWNLAETLTDNDVSAKGKVIRPGFDRALDMIAAGQADVLVGWNLDRITRNRRDTLRLMELGQEHGITIALVRGSDMDLSTPSGRLVAGVLAEVARAEIDVKSDRQVRAYRQQAERGLPHFVSRPYGYTRRGEVVEEEAIVLNQMAQHFLSGWSTTELTGWLNDKQIPAAAGGEWSRRVVKDQLLSKRNVGIRIYKGAEYQGQWKPIFTPELHERITSEWQRRHGKTKRDTRYHRRYLLTGLLYCGECGAPMAGGAHADRQGEEVRAKYRCVRVAKGNGCGNLMRVAVTLDHLVRESVLYRLDSPEMKKLLMQQESQAELIAPLRDESEVLRGRLESLLDDYTDGTLTKQEYVYAKGRVLDALAGVEAELAALYSSEAAQSILSPSTTLRDAWDNESNGWRRRLIGLVVDKIIVNKSHGRMKYEIDGKAYRFDPSAVEIRWKV